jgi:hypothetical protein
MQTKLQDYMSKKLQVNNNECLIVILLFSLLDFLLTNFYRCILSCLHSCLKLFISYYLVSVNFLKVFFVCEITYIHVLLSSLWQNYIFV